ncbi:Protein of unknown function [Pyronema omphalodes CBS 100304]|uniref:Uncharacterized protein n=1 Tax=Pyronema omphalodes (strain CBS 100304) TaxID=1076935 RepID=U4L0C4_PYROM|nr:Protein of unknown function [Pyronema omphalodes CBS 100304]
MLLGLQWVCTVWNTRVRTLVRLIIELERYWLDIEDVD